MTVYKMSQKILYLFIIALSRDFIKNMTRQVIILLCLLHRKVWFNRNVSRFCLQNRWT